MKLELSRTSIHLIPENESEEVYLESFGLTKEGDTISAIRVAPMGLSHTWPYLELRKPIP